MKVALKATLIIFFALVFAACGFQLRGAYAFPFESLHISGADYTMIVASLKHAVRASNATRLVEDKKDAQAIFVPTSEIRQPIILSLSSSGRAREKRLFYSYGYRVVDQEGRDLIKPSVVQLSRDLTYADSAILAKEQEETLLWRDMENDLVQQLMRRLAAAKIQTPQELDREK